MISGMPWVGVRSAPAPCWAAQIVWNPQGLQAIWQRSFPERLKVPPKLSRAAPRSRRVANRLESACFTSDSTRGGTVLGLDILSVSVRMLRGRPLVHGIKVCRHGEGWALTASQEEELARYSSGNDMLYKRLCKCVSRDLLGSRAAVRQGTQCSANDSARLVPTGARYVVEEAKGSPSPRHCS